MTPLPQDASTKLEIMDLPDSKKVKIVISGMSGLYPDSHSVKELSDILYNKINPVNAEGLRFKFNHPEVIQYAGSVPGLSYFDAQFFKVHYRLSNAMDPMARKILEHSYQAIYDAGVNPEHLSGKRVGVYIGTCYAETEKTCFYQGAAKRDLGIAGCSRTMFANRISYWLNAKGPSMAIDEACCSSTAALEQAYLALSRGECEAAIVGGSYLCLHPQSSVHYRRLMRLCDDGKTKSFDENADGCARSEAINVLFLQKAEDALRVYAQVLHAKSEFTSILDDKTGPNFGFERDLKKTVSFVKNFYEEAKVSAQAIEYVEAFGCAEPEADKIELQTIEQVFCGQRDTPLLVGSVLSNIGYNEAASGISGITKVLLGYHTGQLAANLHSSNPRKDVVALNDGRMRIVTEHESFGRTYAAVNGMSVTGVNAHVLLHGQYRPKDLNRYMSSIPYLVTISGRYEEAVSYVLENLKSQPIDPEQLRLLNNIHQSSIAGHLGRGFIILKTDEDQKTLSLCEKSEYFDNAPKPLWFVYSGMGSQWAGMGAQLMRIPIFAAAIEKCRRVLEPKGIDIVHIITTDDERIFDNILHSFVGIAAIQIGLTDILRALGLTPDGIIGHSVGELGCAYADGCLTAEEMILSAYSRGLVSLETPFIRGSMAAIGLGYEQIVTMCPSEIEVACHNGPESSTISGPADKMRDFVAELTSKGIFAKEVPCSNIAYHSRYIASAGPHLLQYLSEVIKSPKPRTKRWISSSVPQDKWDTPAAQLCSAEYHTNNLLSPVLFEETSRLIPKNAVIVEVAPHGLLQAILKRSLASCTNIALTRRKHPDNAYLLLESIGMLFMEGYNPKLHVLYPEVELPVSTGTPFLSHLVKWAHGEKWPLALYTTGSRTSAATCDHIICWHDAESSYLRGNAVRGRTIYPFAATLMVVWDTLAMVLGLPKKQQSVRFNDLHLYSQPIIHDLRELKISVTLSRGTGNFEVLCENTKVATGKINFVKKLKYSYVTEEKPIDDMSLDLTAEDIYKSLQNRDYSYNGEFRSIERAHESFSEGLLAWNNNWVTLIDGLLQLHMLRENHTAVSVPTKIRNLNIDVQKHEDIVQKSLKTNDKVLLKAEIIEELNVTRCGGITLSDIIFENLAPVSDRNMSLKALKFVPYTQSVKDVFSSFEVLLQIVGENVSKASINLVGIVNQLASNSIFDKMNKGVQDVFGVGVTYEQINRETALKNGQNNFLADADVVLVQNLSVDDDLCQLLHFALRNNQFVINEEDSTCDGRYRPSSLYRVLSVHTLVNDDNIKQSQLQLARWGGAPAAVATTTVTVRTESDFTLLNSARTYLTSGHRLLVIAPYPSINGLKELIQTWRKETSRNNIDLILVHENSNAYLSDNELPDIDLAIRVLNNETWGGEYYVSISDSAVVSKNVTLQCSKIGDLNSLTWVEATEIDGAGIDVMVHYAGINKIDVKKADGSICYIHDAKNSYGMDFSGVTKSGQRVMGLVPSGAASSMVRAQPELLWPVPAHWSLEDAATVPLAYAHAFYCLAIQSNIKPGYNILVHEGTGALGQAVISIALGYGCQVFTTVSDMRKKRFLLRLFPELKADHIGNSCDASFKDMVLSITNGNGCNIVINSIGGNLKNSSLNCVGSHGYCIDVSQLIDQDDYAYGMFNLTHDRNYRTSDCFTIFNAENTEDKKAVFNMIVDGISSGLVRPLSRVAYAPQDVSRAFRLVSESRHRGKVLLNMYDRALQVQNRITGSSDRSHLILCNDETLGLQFADRLVERGARKLCVHIKRQSMPYLQLKIRSLQESGVKVLAFSNDLSGEMDIAALVNSAARLGPLEGVYVTVGENQGESYERLVNSLDSVTRKLCSDIKYFAVLNISSKAFGMNTCLERADIKLPATFVSLPELGVEAGLYRSAVDATERALRNGHAVQRASLLPVQHTSMLQKIASIANITIPENSDISATLEDLGLESEKISSIRYLLRVDYNVYFEEERIPLLTLKTIRQLDKTLTATELDTIEGLSTFYTYVDSDELLATTDIVFLPTLTNSASMRDDEFDVTQTFLSIVPGIEGHNNKFRPLCERLKLTALVLQPGLDQPHETVRETAERYAEALLKKAGLQNSFYLLGYESGVSVALEVASILEDHGLTGIIYCIGYSPNGFIKFLQKQLSKYETQEQLQDAVARHMFTLMANRDTTGLDNALQGAKTWSQKVDACVRTLLGRVSHSAQYARTLIDTALVRIEKARDYVPTTRALRSQLVQLLPVVGGEEALPYSLQEHSQLPVIVHQLHVPLAQATNDLRCSSIVNSYLDKTILEDFEKKNTCDTYLLNGNSFMQIEKD